MFREIVVSVCALAAFACGGGGGDSSCDESRRKAAVQAAVNDWYLYQDLIPVLSPSDYATAGALLQALTSPARAAGKDRGWSYLMDRRTYEQYFQDGQSIGFGWSLAPVGAGAPEALECVVVRQVFAGSAADQAGFARGDRIEAIGPKPDALTEVAGRTSDAVGAMLSTAGAGVSRSFRVLPVGGATTVIRTMATAGYDVVPVPLYWTSGTTGYVQLRTFIEPAEDMLRTAFRAFRSAGVTDVIIDLRYNGGGAVHTAVVLANLLGGGLDGQRMFRQEVNAHHPEENGTAYFAVESAAGTFRRVAFITTHSSASASELVPNVLDPYRTSSTIAYVGERTYGKPVGQFVFDLTGCDTKLFLISFRLVNDAGDQDYFEGLPDASSNAPLCEVGDDLEHPQGAQDEAMTVAARHFVEQGECPPVTPALRGAGRPEALEFPIGPDAGPAARDMPGTF